MNSCGPKNPRPKKPSRRGHGRFDPSLARQGRAKVAGVVVHGRLSVRVRACAGASSCSCPGSGSGARVCAHSSTSATGHN